MKLSLCSSFLLLVGPGFATEPARFTIDALVADVVARNPEVQFYQAEIEAARAGRRSAGALGPPELSLEGGRKRVHDPRGALAGEGIAWSVAVSQTFEWPGRLGLRKSIANRQVDLAELGLERFKSALAARAQALAYGLHIAAEKAASTREVAERYEALREVFLARDPAGLTPLLETRVIEAQELALKRRATGAAIAHRTAMVELNRLRDAPLEAPLEITAPSLAFDPAAAAAELLSAARERNFDFQIKRVELEQQGLVVSLARNERFPAVTLSPFYSRETAAERETVVGVGLSVPLPFTASSRSGVEVAEARRRQAEVAMRIAQRELERDVLTAAQTYAAKVAEIRSWAPDSIAKFREAAALADRHYRLGAVPLGTYVELQSAYLEAVEALLETQYEALQAGLQLEQLSGLRPDAAEALR